MTTFRILLGLNAALQVHIPQSRSFREASNPVSLAQGTSREGSKRQRTVYVSGAGTYRRAEASWPSLL